MFTAWDYAAFAAMLLISIGIGLYFGCTGGRQRTTREYMLADRTMGLLPVSLSQMSGFTSAVTVLGLPAEMYVFGTQFWMVWVGYAISVLTSAYIFIPVFYNLRLTSVFEYLELRYDRGIRVIVSIAYIIHIVLYMGIVLYTPALALAVVMGFSKWGAVLVVGLVCIFYSALGGMKAVIWADVVQIIIMFGSLFAILIQGSIDHGGFGNIWRMMDEGDRIHFWDFSMDPTIRHTVWSLGIGATFSWTSMYGTDQALVQRALCTPNLRTAQMALWLTFPGQTALLVVGCMCGSVLYAQYRDCDPLTGPDHLKSDQLLPLYVRDHLEYPLVPGLFVAAVFSASLSSVASGMNVLAAVVLEDMVRPFCLPEMNESTAANVSKGLAVGFGVLMILSTYVVSNLGGALQVTYTFFGMISGPILGIFTLGMINPWSNKFGAYVGFISGLVATSWLGIGAFIYKPSDYKPPVSLAGCPVDNSTVVTSLYHNYSTASAPVSRPEDKAGYLSFYGLSYMWYAAFAVVVVNVVGVVVSLLTCGADPKKVDPRLLTPAVQSFCCCLPAKFRRCIQCNIDRTQSDDDIDVPASTEKNDDKGHTNEALTSDTQI